MAKETYGKVARGPDLPPRIRPTEPEQNTARTVTMKDERVSIPSFSNYWVVPSYHTGKEGEAEALDLLSEILGGGTRSRMYQKLVVGSDLASGAGAYYQGTTLDDTSFALYGSPRGAGGMPELEKGVAAEIARIIDDGVTETELEKAKNRFVRSMIFARDNQASHGQHLRLDADHRRHRGGRAGLARAHQGGDDRAGAGRRQEISAARDRGDRLSPALRRGAELMRPFP